MLLTNKFVRKKPKWPRNLPSYEQEMKCLSKCKFNLFFNLWLGIAQFIDFVCLGGQNKHFWRFLLIV